MREVVYVTEGVKSVSKVFGTSKPQGD